MSIIQEAKKRAHAEGKIIHNNEIYEIPDEYKAFIGKLSDHILYIMSYEYVGIGEKRGPKVRIPSSVVESLGEELEWNKLSMAKLIKIVIYDGLENIRNSTASQYMSKEGIGKKTVDALVAIGLIDDRDAVKPTKTMTVDCYIDGVFYEEREKFDYDIDTLEISRAVELAFGGKNVRGRFVGKIQLGKSEP